jgi:hypothetical protein
MKGGPVRAAQVREAQLLAELSSLRASFNAFRCLLHSPKFAGREQDGSRKDWIATSDVLCWLSDAQRDALQAAAAICPCPKCGRPFTQAPEAPSFACSFCQEGSR